MKHGRREGAAAKENGMTITVTNPLNVPAYVSAVVTEDGTTVTCRPVKRQTIRQWWRQQLVMALKWVLGE